MTDGKDMDKGSYITKDGKKAHIALDSESYYINDSSETSDSFSGANTLILNDDRIAYSALSSLNYTRGCCPDYMHILYIYSLKDKDIEYSFSYNTHHSDKRIKPNEVA